MVINGKSRSHQGGVVAAQAEEPHACLQSIGIAAQECITTPPHISPSQENLGVSTSFFVCDATTLMQGHAKFQHAPWVVFQLQ